MALAKSTLALLLLTALFQVSFGAVYKVGDSAGWIVGNIDYSNWASSKNFHPGDVIVFNYNNKFHDVEQVTLQEFQSCNATSSPIATYTTGSDSITLKSPGHYYFLCGVPGHCQAGQKVDIMVTPDSLRPIPSPAPAPSPNASTPSPSPSPTPSPAQAPSGSSPSMAPTPSANISSAPSLNMSTFWSALVTLAIFANALAF